MKIVAALLAAHGLFLILIGLIAFFGGFVGVYDLSSGHPTPGAIVAVLGAVLAWIFLLEGIASFRCAQGLLARQRRAFWLTMALEVINLFGGWCALTLKPFASWLIVLSMSAAGGDPPLSADSDGPAPASMRERLGGRCFLALSSIFDGMGA